MDSLPRRKACLSRRSLLKNISVSVVASAFGLRLPQPMACPVVHHKYPEVFPHNPSLSSVPVIVTATMDVESMHHVWVRVIVDSPMTQADHVEAIMLLAEQNLQPVLGKFNLTPNCGRAEVSKRIRLCGSLKKTGHKLGQQKIVAAVRMNSGKLLTANTLVNIPSHRIGDR